MVPTQNAAGGGGAAMSHDVNGSLLKLGELIKEIRVTMMHTWSSRGGQRSDGAGEVLFDGAHRSQPIPLRARPMYTQRLDPATYNGVLWFFADATSNLVHELGQSDGVLLSYASPEKNIFVSVGGRAHCEHDPVKAAELWNLHAKGWWPQGPGSENLTLIRVTIERGEYWDGPSNTSYMLHLLKAVASGERVNVSAEHAVIDARQ